MQLEFEAGDDKEYKVDGIWDSAVYAKESTTSQLSGFYYLISWKSYSEEENIWEPASAIQHLRRLVTSYHKDNPEKSIATSLPVDMAPPIVRPMQGQPAGPMAVLTKKRGRLAGFTTITTTKQAKKS